MIISSADTNIVKVDKQMLVILVTFSSMRIDSQPDTITNIDAMGPEHLSKLSLKSCDCWAQKANQQHRFDLYHYSTIEQISKQTESQQK